MASLVLPVKITQGLVSCFFPSPRSVPGIRLSAKETHEGTYQILNQDNLPSVEHLTDSKALPSIRSHRELVSGADQMCLSGR